MRPLHHLYHSRLIAAVFMLGAAALSLSFGTARASPAVVTLPRVDLTLWHQQGAQTMAQLGIQKIFDSWAAIHAPGSTLTLVQKDSDDLSTQFAALPAGMTAPDLLWASASTVVDDVQHQRLQAVDSLVDSTLFVPALVDPVRVNGQLYGVPLQGGNFLMLFYNKQLVPQPPQTFHDLITLAVNLQGSHSGDKHFAAFAFNELEPYWEFPYAYGYGATLFTADGHSTALDSPAWRKAYQFVHDLKYKSLALPESCDYECADNGFRSGEIAMIINGDWALQGDQNYVTQLGDKLGIAPLPALGSTASDQLPVPLLVGQYLFVPAATTGDKLTTAAAFVHFLSTDTATALAWTVPNRRLPALLSALNSDTISADPILSQTRPMLLAGVSLPLRPETACVLTTLGLPYSYLMNDMLQPADVMKQTQEKAAACFNQK